MVLLRQANMSFEYTQSVQGTVSAVDYQGRSISPTVSSYQDLRANDVRMRGRTAALPGNYSSNESISLQAYTSDSFYVTLTKESGSPIVEIDFAEQWPVLLKSSKLVLYDGEQINDAEYFGNNLDYAGSSFLYSSQLAKESHAGMLLRRMNSTVIVTNSTVEAGNLKESLTLAEFMPSMEMLYQLYAENNGTSELKHRLASSSYDFKSGTYPAISEGVEWYTGNYTILRSLYTRSDYKKSNDTEQEEDWYPCCFAGQSSADIISRSNPEKNADDVFDCSCFRQ